MNRVGLSVIVPCYNEQEVVGAGYQRIKKVLADNRLTNSEILYVDDGSEDRTPGILSRIATQDRRIRIIRFSRNFGQQAAISAGLANCSGRLAVILDADLQDPPELIPAMIRQMSRDRCNVVYGVRRSRRGDRWFKRATAGWYYKILSVLSDFPVPENAGDFKLIDRKVIDEFKKLGETNKYVRGLISWIGFKQSPFFYRRDPRFRGATKYPFLKMLSLACAGLVYFTKRPLHIAFAMGLFSILVGLSLAVRVVWAALFEPSRVVPGWASTIIVIIFFGGVQLLSIGIIGRYVACVFDEVKKRPEYVISKRINF